MPNTTPILNDKLYHPQFSWCFIRPAFFLMLYTPTFYLMPYTCHIFHDVLNIPHIFMPYTTQNFLISFKMIYTTDISLDASNTSYDTYNIFYDALYLLYISSCLIPPTFFNMPYTSHSLNNALYLLYFSWCRILPTFYLMPYTSHNFQDPLYLPHCT